MEKELYMNEVVQVLIEKTKSFQFSEMMTETDANNEKQVSAVGMKLLVKRIIYIAQKKYYQIPESSRAEYSVDDWIQEAMVLLCGDAVDTYDPEKTRYFDVFAKTHVNQRLIDFQRSVFRQNPCVDEDFKKLVISKRKELKKETGTEPAKEALADALEEITDRSREDIMDKIETGVNERLLVKDGDTVPKKDVKKKGSPEDQYIRAEMRRILWNCINKLEPKHKVIFVRHEYYNVSLNSFFKSAIFSSYFGPDVTSYKSYQRRYNDLIFNSVRDCVRMNYYPYQDEDHFL